MNKNDPIVVIAERDNPQLGTYYFGPFFAKVRTFNAANGNFSIRYLKDMDSHQPTKYMATGHTRENDNSLYGSCTYYAYTFEQALSHFQDVIDSYEGLSGITNHQKQTQEKFKEFLEKVQEKIVNKE